MTTKGLCLFIDVKNRRFMFFGDVKKTERPDLAEQTDDQSSSELNNENYMLCLDIVHYICMNKSNGLWRTCGMAIAAKS